MRHLAERLPKLSRVESVLEEQRQKLVQRMSETLRQELMSSGHLWERRLCAAVAEYWGVSPFSAVLRFYNGFGSWLASMGLFRARTTAQMALIGAVQGARWLTSKQQEADAESRLQRVGSFGLDDAPPAGVAGRPRRLRPRGSVRREAARSRQPRSPATSGGPRRRGVPGGRRTAHRRDHRPAGDPPFGTDHAVDVRDPAGGPAWRISSAVRPTTSSSTASSTTGRCSARSTTSTRWCFWRCGRGGS